MKNPKFEDLVRGLILLEQSGKITPELISNIVTDVITDNYYTHLAEIKELERKNERTS